MEKFGDEVAVEAGGVVATVAPPRKLPGKLETLLFDGALYDAYPLSANWIQVERLLRNGGQRYDAFCPWCHARTTFSRFGSPLDPLGNLNRGKLESKGVIDHIEFVCARAQNHKVTFYLRIADGTVQKIGQFPSLADIANDEAKRFSKVLEKKDSSELHKAIGLAAHGVGIGSFVYFRRVFERLIQSRFDAHRAVENWTDDEWVNRRMDERIKLMKAHLPEFIVKNSAVYGILSRGIHELDEETCLAMFEVVKESIVEMLEEDLRARQKRARQENLTKQLQDLRGKLEAE